MDYRHVYEILHDLKQTAIQRKVPILVTMHREDFGNGSKWAKVSDVVLTIDECKNQNSQEYALCLEERGKKELELGIIFDSGSGKWHRVTNK